MASFNFRLRSVHELRRHIENEYKDTHEAENQKLRELLNLGSKLLSEHKHWSQQYIKIASEGMSPTQAIRLGSYIEELLRQIRENELQIENQAEVVEKARLELIEKMKERKTLDKLYEKQYAEFTASDLLKTEKEIEDLIKIRM